MALTNPCNVINVEETRTIASKVTVFVCVSCSRDQAVTPTATPGAELLASLELRFCDAGARDVTVTAVECLAVCKRPCTLAMTAAEKWTYVIGDIDAARHADEVVAATLAYQRSSNGIVPWRERPETFRKGVVSRIPPLGFVPPEPELA